jgi:hypothetical protein
LEEVPSPLCLGISRILDLIPHSLQRVGIGLPLGHDALEVQPLGGLKQLAPMFLHSEHSGED